MFRPEKVGNKVVSLSWHEMSATIHKNELYIDHLEKKYKTKFLTRMEHEKESALEWWSKITDLKKVQIESKTFGVGDQFEDNTLTDSDIIKMWKQCNVNP